MTLFSSNVLPLATRVKLKSDAFIGFPICGFLFMAYSFTTLIWLLQTILLISLLLWSWLWVKVKSDLRRLTNVLLWPWNEVKVKCVVCPERLCHGWYLDTIKQAYLIRPSAIQPLLFPIGLTLERSTLAYKSEVKGRSDLILWLQGDIDQRYLHAW